MHFCKASAKQGCCRAPTFASDRTERTVRNRQQDTHVIGRTLGLRLRLHFAQQNVNLLGQLSFRLSCCLMRCVAKIHFVRSIKYILALPCAAPNTFLQGNSFVFCKAKNIALHSLGDGFTATVPSVKSQIIHSKKCTYCKNTFLHSLK